MPDEGSGQTAIEVAAQLWPPPDPTNHHRRAAVDHLVAFDRALQRVIELRDAAVPIVFEDLGRLWIKQTRLEVLLGLVLQILTKDAAGHLSDALGLIKDARLDNQLRSYEERALERLPEAKDA